MGIDYDIPVYSTCKPCNRPIYRFPKGSIWYLNTREIEANPGENVAKCDRSPDEKHTP